MTVHDLESRDVFEEPAPVVILLRDGAARKVDLAEVVELCEYFQGLEAFDGVVGQDELVELLEGGDALDAVVGEPG